MTKRHANKRVIAVIGGATATALAQAQRFSNVTPDHEAH